MTFSKKKTSKTTESTWPSILFLIVTAFAFMGSLPLIGYIATLVLIPLHLMGGTQANVQHTTTVISPLFIHTVKFKELYPPGYRPSGLFELLFNPVVLVIGELLLIILALLLGTASMREEMQIKRRRLINKVQARQSVGMVVASEELSVAQTQIPKFRDLLRRNAISLLFFVPFSFLLTLVAFGAFYLVFPTQGKTSSPSLLLAIPFILYGWLFGLQIGWRRIARTVDRRLQRKRKDDPIPEIAPPLSQSTTLSSASVLAQPQPISEPRESLHAKQRGEWSEPVFSARRKATILFLALTGCGLVIGLILSQAARASGASAELLLIAPIGVGELLFVVAGRWLIRLFPKDHWLLFAHQSEGPIHRGEYETVLARADRMVQDRPNWMTRFTAAAFFGEAGQFEKAEQLARASLRDLAEKLSAQDTYSESFRNSMLSVCGMLIDILTSAGKMDEAIAEISNLPAVDKPNSLVERSLAKFYMYRGQIDLALPHLETAKRLERRQRPKGYRTAVYAWATALQGDSVRADDLIAQAFKQVSPQNIASLAEIYLYAGYVACAERKPMAARDEFRKAVELNTDGAYGRIARRELERDSL